MYKLTDKILNDVIIVNDYEIRKNNVFFVKILKVIKTPGYITYNSAEEIYGIIKRFGPISETIIEPFGNAKVGEILYGKSD